MDTVYHTWMVQAVVMWEELEAPKGMTGAGLSLRQGRSKDKWHHSVATVM